MAQYRKKPVVIEATQWRGPGHELPGVLKRVGQYGPPDCYYVITIHGQETYIAQGDWIITESDGVHHYPCKPEVFRASYEAVEG